MSKFINAYMRLPELRGKYRLGCCLDKFGPFKAKTPNGVHIKVYTTSTNDKLFFHQEVENEVLFNEISKLPSNGVFVDVGANAGFYSAICARTLSKDGIVLSWEPSIREFMRLLWTKEHNKHECKWVCMHEALSNTDTISPIVIHGRHTGRNTLSQKGFDGKRDWVHTVRLDGVWGNLYPEKIIDLVKIDVEGWEYPVCIGLEKLLCEKKIKTIIVEVTRDWYKNNGFTVEGLYDYFIGHGYTPEVGNNEKWQYDEIFRLSGKQ